LSTEEKKVVSSEEEAAAAEETAEVVEAEESQLSLDDERRVKVLSPGALVAKRFFRNRLAMIGLIILIAMFLFSFVGGWINPYGESQVFEDYSPVVKDFAGAIVNEEYRFVEKDGATIPSGAKTSLILAVNNGETTYTAGDNTYSIVDLGLDSWIINGTAPVATVDKLAGNYIIKSDTLDVTDALTAAFTAAEDAGETSFTYNGEEYVISGSGRSFTISSMQELGVGSKLVIEGEDLSYEFTKGLLTAMGQDQKSFSADGKTYTLEVEDLNGVILSGSDEIASVSDYSIKGVENGTVISDELRARIIEAIGNDEASFTLTDEEGNEVEYELTRDNNRYTIRTETATKLIQTYLAPSTSHWLGTDGYGMDILTRLMYGGRISLIIGFVVVILETIIGVVLGGIAGYFGKWVDMVIMRIVDIFYCIPTWPILIILGAIMDSYQIGPKIRIYFMMVVLAVLGWPSITRLVRGQILSLREQEFMTATEATGLTVSRRIFRHLVPNVIPQLIVQCTMSLGGIILTESTMSFLGIGVKFPYASWGNIISSVSNVFVMTNYWYCWIPAGMLILLTVLGFNFVGDGLRDAFDPKMKR
jgi:peptide/nickel transport system permease protein